MEEQKKHREDTVPEITWNGTDNSVFPFPHYPTERFGNDSDIPADDCDETSLQEPYCDGDKEGICQL